MRWTLLDIEAIAIRKAHACTRKMYILGADGKTSELWEFTPCTDITKIASCYVKSFKYCRRNIHELSYYPSNMSPPCSSAVQKLASFVQRNAIQVVFYKGAYSNEICATYYTYHPSIFNFSTYPE